MIQKQNKYTMGKKRSRQDVDRTKT